MSTLDLLEHNNGETYTEEALKSNAMRLKVGRTASLREDLPWRKHEFFLSDEAPNLITIDNH
jgi:hypothetical protein